MLDTDTSLILLDVREPWEYETCHIEGSLHISMNELAGRQTELGKNDNIVVICHHGMRSFQVSQYLEQNGFNKVMNLEGGINAWSRDIDASIPQY